VRVSRRMLSGSRAGPSSPIRHAQVSKTDLLEVPLGDRMNDAPEGEVSAPPLPGCASHVTRAHRTPSAHIVPRAAHVRLCKSCPALLAVLRALLRASHASAHCMPPSTPLRSFHESEPRVWLGLACGSRGGTVLAPQEYAETVKRRREEVKLRRQADEVPATDLSCPPHPVPAHTSQWLLQQRRPRFHARGTLRPCGARPLQAVLGLKLARGCLCACRFCT
jgi:hypothetical protein